MPQDDFPSTSFLHNAWQSVKAHKGIICIGVLMVAAAGMVIPGPMVISTHSPETQRQNAARYQMHMALIAFDEYISKYNQLPSGTTRQIFRQLNGANPHHIQFLEVDPKDLSGLGDWLDPWRHPYQFYYSEDSILIRTAGIDGKFEISNGASDDLFWESSYFLK